jgi:GH15 family glucan-1,4-alpha-glucosidase
MTKSDDYLPIADYAAIGNLRTVALVGLNGSIDWCCLPSLDDGSVFGSLLDHRRGGRFRVAPVGQWSSSQRYRGETNILETEFRATGGRLICTDFIPVSGDLDSADKNHGRAEIHRVLSCEGSGVEVEVEWSPRFDYARARTEISADADGYMARGGDDTLYLSGLPQCGQVADDGFGPVVRAKFYVEPGRPVSLACRWGGPVDRNVSSEHLLNATEQAWRAWVDKDSMHAVRDWAGPWRDLVIRSGLALKLLTYRDTGAIAAAATTSLPEEIGGIRNWDYRYFWVRDAGLTAQALLALGHREAAVAFLHFVERSASQCLEQGGPMRIMYGLHGQREDPEIHLDHLEGYRNSRPVRIGNGAFDQPQHDVYGEIFNVAYELVRVGEPISPRMREFLRAVADRACEIWQEPDQGIWEVRDKPRHYVYSKAMSWAALDRAVILAQRHGLGGDVQRWAKTRDEIRKQVLDNGFDPKRKAFVQSYGVEHLDAANLVLPMIELLPFDDPRVQGTIDATLRELTENGLVYRYHMDDGLEGGEGAFGLTTFWLVDALTFSGRYEEAYAIFEGIAKRANHVGLYAEQFDPPTGLFLGNFPQAFSHIGLINSTLHMAYTEGRPTNVPPPVGSREHRLEVRRDF